MSKESDLFEALVTQVADFILNRVSWSTPLTATGEGNNAETAHVVAATHDGDPRMQLVFVFPHRNNVGVGLIEGELNVHSLFTGLGFRLQYFNEAGEVTIGVRTCH